MNKEIINRLKALEAMNPDRLVLLVEDGGGNQFECSLDEYEKHAPGDWDFKRVVRGANLEDVRRVLAAWAPNSAI